MSRNKKTVVALLILAAFGGLAWALLPPRPDPQMVKVQQLQERLFDPNTKMADEDRRQAFGELRKETEKLSSDQRDELMRDNPFAQRMRQRVADYFDLPEDQRRAQLDEDIDRMEKFRKDMQKRRASGERPPGPPGGFGNRGGMDQNQRNEMRKRMLDNTSPQERAMFGEYMKQLQERRQQRGLSSMGGPFGG